MRTLGSLAALAALSLPLAACTVKVPTGDALFTCATDADCGGDGFVCNAIPGQKAFCCKATQETCDGLDNDCNGVVDDLGEWTCYTGPEGTENVGICHGGTQQCVDGVPTSCLGERTPSSADLCNGFDDDCDGKTDEDYDLLSDEANCGTCGNACAADQWCAQGRCSKSVESCNDGIDNDQDGKTDCADSDCVKQRCKPTPQTYTCDALLQCSCDGAVTPAPEDTCDDRADDDCDGNIDCADSDCEAKTCGVGCLCAGGKQKETECANGRDDDGDTKLDCADEDCDTKACGPGCLCTGVEKHETDCKDGADNDSDRLRDCIDPDCDGKACQLYGDGGYLDGTCQSKACK